MKYIAGMFDMLRRQRVVNKNTKKTECVLYKMLYIFSHNDGLTD